MYSVYPSEISKFTTPSHYIQVTVYFVLYCVTSSSIKQLVTFCNCFLNVEKRTEVEGHTHLFDPNLNSFLSNMKIEFDIQNKIHIGIYTS